MPWPHRPALVEGPPGHYVYDRSTRPPAQASARPGACSARARSTRARPAVITRDPADDRPFGPGLRLRAPGLAIAREAPDGHCLMVDKTSSQVEYARRNAELNGIGNVRCDAVGRVSATSASGASTSWSRTFPPRRPRALLPFLPRGLPSAWRQGPTLRRGHLRAAAVRRVRLRGVFRTTTRSSGPQLHGRPRPPRAVRGRPKEFPRGPIGTLAGRGICQAAAPVHRRSVRCRPPPRTPRSWHACVAPLMSRLGCR